jgi:type II secretory ATPase GspE/PulE/Tfp pilus assembly ATPase PilB-like protein
VKVRYRIDGILHDAMSLPKQAKDGIVARIKVLSNLKLDEHRVPQDGRFKIDRDDKRISFRVSILPVFDGEKIVMRLLDETSKGLTLEKMGLYGRGLEVVHKNIKKPNGMFLVTGPTGSGKTTTLYTIMDILNTPEVNICTIEDPIEYRMPRINQTQIYPKVGLTFATGLRSLLRQDPNIIMVGEIRDKETVEMAIQSAMTGHLVLSTLHTNSAAGALPRLLDMGAEPFLVASTVNTVVAQRLVRKLCPDCKKQHKATAEDLKQVGMSDEFIRSLENISKDKIPGEFILYEAVGCDQCGGEGYHGRIGIFEVLEVDEDVKKLIAQKASSENIENKAREKGMATMLEDGIYKVIQGLTSLEEVLRVTRE